MLVRGEYAFEGDMGRPPDAALWIVEVTSRVLRLRAHEADALTDVIHGALTMQGDQG